MSWKHCYYLDEKGFTIKDRINQGAVALYQTKRTDTHTFITLSTLHGLQTLDPIEVHRPKATAHTGTCVLLSQGTTHTI